MTVPTRCALAIDFAAIECEIDLGTGITDYEFRLLEADEKRKKTGRRYRFGALWIARDLRPGRCP